MILAGLFATCHHRGMVEQDSKKRGKSHPKEPRSINPNKLDSLSWLHRSNGKGIEYMIALKAEASSK